MDVIASFVADAETTELVQPAESSFDDPAMLAQAAAMFGVPFRQERFDSTLTQASAMRLGIVGPIALNMVGPVSRSSRLAAYCRNRVHQRFELGNIVRIGRGQQGGKRNAVGVRDQVMFAAG